jgi:hypothetical protein
MKTDNLKWLGLIVSLPTENATERMRIWRSVKQLGCAMLRDGVYALPDIPGKSHALMEIAAETRKAGGTAYVLEFHSSETTQESFIKSFFDREEQYKDLIKRISGVKSSIPAKNPSVLRKDMRIINRDFEQISATDYFPGKSRELAEAALKEIERLVAPIISPGEPGRADGGIERLNASAFKGKTWATRENPWIDRLASAWLVKRFIDPDAKFLWLKNPQKLPAKAVGFDFDGAMFTHVGDRVTYETLLACFGLEDDKALSRIASVIHFLDVGGIPVAEAPGLEAILAGARLKCVNDDDLLEEAVKTFDWMYAAFTE